MQITLVPWYRYLDTIVPILKREMREPCSPPSGQLVEMVAQTRGKEVRAHGELQTSIIGTSC